jgi:hypothetical protein
MSRGLITSVNGIWNHLPVICRCRHEFTVELGDDVLIRVAKQGLAHTWHVKCPRCWLETPVLLPVAIRPCEQPQQPVKNLT